MLRIKRISGSLLPSGSRIQLAELAVVVKNTEKNPPDQGLLPWQEAIRKSASSAASDPGSLWVPQAPGPVAQIEEAAPGDPTIRSSDLESMLADDIIADARHLGWEAGAHG
jgi:hypothetical protein